MNDRRRDVDAVVRALIDTALRASYLNDYETFFRSLTDAVGVYELNPTLAQCSTSRLRDLLVLIRAGCTVCDILGQPTHQSRILYERAARLTQPFQ